MTEEARAARLPGDIAAISRLDGQKAIFTGAASRLGKAISLGFAHFGADVACLDVDPEGAQKTADEVSALGREGYVVRVDVRDWQSVRAAAEEVRFRSGLWAWR